MMMMMLVKLVLLVLVLLAVVLPFESSWLFEVWSVKVLIFNYRKFSGSFLSEVSNLRGLEWYIWGLPQSGDWVNSREQQVGSNFYTWSKVIGWCNPTARQESEMVWPMKIQGFVWEWHRWAIFNCGLLITWRWWNEMMRKEGGNYFGNGPKILVWVLELYYLFCVING